MRGTLQVTDTTRITQPISSQTVYDGFLTFFKQIPMNKKQTVFRFSLYDWSRTLVKMARFCFFRLKSENKSYSLTRTPKTLSEIVNGVSS